MKKILLGTMLALTAGSAMADQAYPQWEGKKCTIDRRAHKDEIVFKVNKYGMPRVSKTFKRDPAWTDLIHPFKENEEKFGYGYINPDGTCGIINPWTKENYNPLGYRKGELR